MHVLSLEQIFFIHVCLCFLNNKKNLLLECIFQNGQSKWILKIKFRSYLTIIHHKNIVQISIMSLKYYTLSSTTISSRSLPLMALFLLQATFRLQIDIAYLQRYILNLKIMQGKLIMWKISLFSKLKKCLILTIFFVVSEANRTCNSVYIYTVL